MKMKLFYIIIIIPFTQSKSLLNDNLSLEDDNNTLFPNNWIEVPLDHFNLFDNRTWKMRYFTNDEFFKKGQPLFIEVGGEWTIDGGGLQSGQLHKLAKKHQGMLVETEHRYYGKSLPFSTNFSTENLKYLQMEQALEDLAYFIEKFKAKTPGLENSKVILHGCSYPGMLVTWMRLRFPHIVDVSYASSAPLGVGLDYPEYFEVVNDVYANVSMSCIGTIKKGFEKMATLLKTREGRKTVNNALKKWGCGDVEDMSNGALFQQVLYILNVQSDPFQYEEVACLSLAMDMDDTSPFRRLANFAILKSKDQNVCIDNEDANVVFTRSAWKYQTCTEMGTFQTLSKANPKHPFHRNLDIHEWVYDCGVEFGDTMTEDILKKGVERVTRRYGGLKPEVTKVVTVQGTGDPWNRLSVFEDYTPEAPVILVKGSHCIDIKERNDDPEELFKIRNDIRDIISKWITEA